MQRIIPRRDRAHHARRLPHHQRVSNLLLEFRLPQQLRVAPRHQHRQPRLNRRRDRNRRPHFHRDGPRNLLRPLLQSRRDFIEPVGALPGRSFGPASKRPPRRIHRRIHVFRSPFRNRPNHFFRRGRENFNVSGRGGAPAAINKQLGISHHAFFASILRAMNAAVVRTYSSPKNSSSWPTGINRYGRSSLLIRLPHMGMGRYEAKTLEQKVNEKYIAQTIGRGL